ncbi:MAG: hypothetical protein M3Y59_00100 [Myxococcota bacterium]|nr:hypothetical protein [Myxococcota bacterium]
MFIDFAYPSRGIALEADGYSAHGGRRVVFDQDSLRRGRLLALEMIHLSVTHQQLKKEPDALDRRLRTILASHPERRLRPVLAEVFVTLEPTGGGVY